MLHLSLFLGLDTVLIIIYIFVAFIHFNFFIN